MKSSTSVGILGAGISGLSIAYTLQKHGINVSVYEKDKEAGGVIRTHQKDNWLVEQGPNTMLVRDQGIWDFLDELGLRGSIVHGGKQSKKRYIVRNRELCAAPMSIANFLKTDLLSTTAKFRLLKEPFISASKSTDESIASFVRRRLGHEPLDYAVNPFVSGIYAGDPKELSVKHTFSSLFEMEQNHGSLTKGFFKRSKSDDAPKALISFKKGLQSLPIVLHNKLEHTVRLNSTIKKISRDATNWSVQLKSGEIHNHRAIVSTIPTHQLPKSWSDSKSKQSVKKLSNIDYAPMSVLALGFKKNQVNHPLDGFGMLIPEVEPFNLLGCLFSSSLFPSRAPNDHVLLTCFLGGARHRALAARSKQNLIAETMPQLDELLGIKDQPVFTHHTYWAKAIPQYTVGYDNYLHSMEQLEEANPGLFLCGNYRGGVSVPNCFLNGFKTAGKVSSYIDVNYAR